MTTADRPISSTGAAVAALGTRTAGTGGGSFAQRTVDGVTSWLSARTSRRGFLVRAGVVGSALAVDPSGYVLRPGTAYASVCGPGASASSGWTVFCATINRGVNACPPGSIAAGWWKMSGASLCGGDSRYIIDCNATCSHCSTGGTRPGICAKSCQSCSCSTGPSSSCDQRRVCCNDFRYGQCNTQVRQVGAVQCRVVSCTPPWEFENCSTSPATDQRTVDHNSSELPTRYTQITKRYISLGENGSALGASVYGEFSVRGGTAQRYQYGRISYSADTGARETQGAIGRRYVALGAEESLLRFPTSAERAAGDGVEQRFEDGRIYWSSQTGAWDVRGRVGERYAALGSYGGVLGFPLSGETAATRDGGVYQVFEGGRIFSAPGIGAYETRGDIDARYRVVDSARGPLGFPVAAPSGTPGADGRQQLFEHGRITWSAAHGAYATYGRIGERWLALGGAAGVLGFPIRGERDTVDVPGHFQRFENGRVSSSSATGAHETYGGILARWTELGLEGGVLGFPTSGERDAASGAGRYSSFQRGRISYSPATGTHSMGARIAAAYVQEGAEGGTLGFPTTDETVLDDGRRRVEFQGGTLTYDPATGEVIRS